MINLYNGTVWVVLQKGKLMTIHGLIYSHILFLFDLWLSMLWQLVAFISETNDTNFLQHFQVNVLWGFKYVNSIEQHFLPSVSVYTTFVCDCWIFSNFLAVKSLLYLLWLQYRDYSYNCLLSISLCEMMLISVIHPS